MAGQLAAFHARRRGQAADGPAGRPAYTAGRRIHFQIRAPSAVWRPSSRAATSPTASSSWPCGKSFIPFRGGNKEAARQRALQLFPSAHALFSRKKDHQRAEAALIALTPVPGVLPKAVLVEKAEPVA